MLCTRVTLIAWSTSLMVTVSVSKVVPSTVTVPLVIVAPFAVTANVSPLSTIVSLVAVKVKSNEPST